MSRRPHGRAFVDPSNPQAFAVCDRCGFWHNRVDLQPQFIVSGPSVVNTNMAVCERCMDDLQWNLQTIVVPPDPLPIRDPRPENFAVDEIDYLTASGGSHIVTTANEQIVTNQNSQNFGDD